MKKVAIIGAGWAGLSAGVHLADVADVALTIFEAGRVAGGRARQILNDRDNGQHLLIGAYQEAFRVLDQVGVNRETAFIRQNLTWHMHQGFNFRLPSLPTPFDFLFGILRAQRIQWRDQWALLKQMKCLKQWHDRPMGDLTVQQFLQGQRVSRSLREQFWQPLVWSALNTPVATASLRTLTQVLTEGIWHHQGFGDYCVARLNLTQLFADPVLRYCQERGVQYRSSHRVKRLQIKGKTVWLDDQAFDAVIVAIAPYHVADLLPHLRHDLDKLNYHAITTVYLTYPQKPQLPHLIVGFANRLSQWVFDRQRIHHGAPNEIASVISCSEQYGHLNGQQWAQAVHEDVLLLNPNLPKFVEHQVITEKRATVACELARPNFQVNQGNGVFLAGDYLCAHYPATLEMAVRSGKQASQELLKYLYS